MTNLVIVVTSCMLLFTRPVQSQDPSAHQKDAMTKLSNWVGVWKGKGRMFRGPGPGLEVDVTETVESKLSGLLLQFEGVGKAKDENGSERIGHHALGVVSYDPAIKSFKIRAYTMQGHQTDSDLKALPDGSYQWGFTITEPRKVTIRFTITLTEKTWKEVGEASLDEGKTWFKSMEMNLERVK